MHLHDNRGPADAGDPHLPLGRGVVDAGAVVRKARESGALVIRELFSAAAIDEIVAYLEHSARLNSVAAPDLDHVYGSVSMRQLLEVFPMFGLAVDELTASPAKRQVRF